jgi:hypothetical protein
MFPTTQRVTRPWLLAVGLATLLCGVSVHAQQPAADSPWRQRFERARAALVEEQFAQAQKEFETLAQSAASDPERSLAHELAEVARRGGQKQQQTEQPEIRTSDELAVLYTSVALYGLGTGGMVALQFEPKTMGGALLPFIVLTPATVGSVALADSYRRFAHGVPHAIAAGLYLGFGEALWAVGYQHAHATQHDATPWPSNRVSVALWAGSTLGAAVGGLLGAIRRPTPGRVSFTASAGIWTGVLSAFAASAVESQRSHRGQTAYAVGAVGYNVGLLSGILFGPSIAPSAARVRFVDLGGLGGALLGAGGYALFSHTNNSRGNLAGAAIGGTLGVALSWWATSGMPPDHSHDQLRPVLGSNAPSPSDIKPTLVPLPGGFMAGLTGRL